jgi:diacylglycerol kinase (ATP)
MLGFAKRLRNSLSGIRYVALTEPAFRFRAAASVILLALVWWIRTPMSEVFLLIVSLSVMLSAEIANTALEEVCDLIEPRFSIKIKAIKDMLSATVFVAALPAVFFTLSLIFR